jgi:hypothetical protein
MERRRAARQIDFLVKAHPGLIAFPLRRVGVVTDVTPWRAQPADVIVMRRAA